MARSSLIVMGAFVAAKLFGLLRERAIAFRFGASPDYDAYVAAFTIPDLLFTLIAGGALVSAFLPVFSDAKARGQSQEAWRIASGVTSLVFLATAALSAGAALTAPWLVRAFLAPGFTLHQQALTVSLMRIVLVSTVVFAISGIQMGILNAYQHFLLPALAPIGYNVGILFGALWLAPAFGIRGLAYGVVLGSVMHLVIKIPALVRYGFRYYPILGARIPGVRQVLALMWPRVLALGTVKLVFVVNTRLASDLVGGSLSALNYAWVISQMPQTILGTAIATVAFPTLAELSALARHDDLRRTAVGALRVLMALSVPAAVGLWVLADPAIGVLLRTGAFDDRAADATRGALRMFSLGLVGHVTLEVVARTFYAQKDTRTPLVGAVLATALNIALAFWWVAGKAQAGLALANSVAVSVEVTFLAWLLARRLGGIAARPLWAALWRSLVAGAAMAATTTLALAALAGLPAMSGPGGTFGRELLRLAVGSMVGLSTYLAVATAIGLSELQLVWRLARERATGARRG